MNAYDELVDVIATGPADERIVRFRVSDETQRIVAELPARAKRGALTPHENVELERYLQFEHVVRLAKARASPYLMESGATGGAIE